MEGGPSFWRFVARRVIYHFDKVNEQELKKLREFKLKYSCGVCGVMMKPVESYLDHVCWACKCRYCDKCSSTESLCSSCYVKCRLCWKCNSIDECIWCGEHVCDECASFLCDYCDAEVTTCLNCGDPMCQNCWDHLCRSCYEKMSDFECDICRRILCEDCTTSKRVCHRH